MNNAKPKFQQVCNIEHPAGQRQYRLWEFAEGVFVMHHTQAKSPSAQLRFQLSRNRATELLREIERLDGESKRLIEQSERMTELCDSIHRELEKLCLDSSPTMPDQLSTHKKAAPNARVEAHAANLP